jgi:hypothetical protein
MVREKNDRPPSTSDSSPRVEHAYTAQKLVTRNRYCNGLVRPPMSSYGRYCGAGACEEWTTTGAGMKGSWADPTPRRQGSSGPRSSPLFAWLAQTCHGFATNIISVDASIRASHPDW